MVKRCLHCSAEFRPHGNKRYCDQHGRGSERGKAAVRKYQQVNLARTAANRRRGDLKRWYGITPEEFDEMLISQGGRCAICGTDTPGGPGSRFMVDHDHSTKAVRGLLCCSCNFLLGYAKDSSDTLISAIYYLSTRRGG